MKKKRTARPKRKASKKVSRLSDLADRIEKIEPTKGSMYDFNATLPYSDLESDTVPAHYP